MRLDESWSWKTKPKHLNVKPIVGNEARRDSRRRRKRIAGEKEMVKAFMGVEEGINPFKIVHYDHGSCHGLTMARAIEVAQENHDRGSCWESKHM